MTERIIVTEGGTYCGDCHRDLYDGTDRDPSAFVQARLPDGRCDCCGSKVVDGNLMENDHS